MKHKPFSKILKKVVSIIEGYLHVEKKPLKKEIVEIGLRLRALRNKKNLSLETVSKAAGFNPKQLHLYEKGKVEPNVLKLRNLASFYNVALAYLIFGNNFHKKNLPKLSLKLTKKECDVAFLIIQGYSNDEIISYLRISPYTLIDHINNIKRKIGSKDQSRVMFIRLIVDNYSID